MNKRVTILVAVALMISLFTFVSVAAAAKKGCTPGYWKNHAGTGIGLAFETVFEDTSVTSPSTTLQQAAALGGGGIYALVRHAAAAYLNAINAVDYSVSAGDVVALFNAANPDGDVEGTKTMFETWNELGCPL